MKKTLSILCSHGKKYFNNKSLFFLASLGMLCGCFYWKLLRSTETHIMAFLISSFSMFVLYTCCIKLFTHGETEKETERFFWWIILFSILFRISLIPVLPSDDIYRYLWEGKLINLGISPYKYPAESPALLSIRDSFYPKINHKDLNSIYPPLCQYVFALAVFFSYSITSMKITFTLFDIMNILLISLLLKERGESANRVIIYAYNPLVLFCVAAQGHNDSLLIFFFLASILAIYKNKYAAAHTLLALSFLSKFIFALFLPFYIKKTGKKHAIYFILTATMCSVPFITTIPRLFNVLFIFGRDFRFNDSVHAVIYSFLNVFFAQSTALLSAKIATVTAVLSLLIIFLQKKVDILQTGYLFTGLLLLVLPTLHPWYLLWIIPFLAFYKNRAWILLTGTSFLYFVVISEYTQTHIWKENYMAKAFIYFPFYWVLIRDYIHSRLYLNQSLTISRCKLN